MSICRSMISREELFAENKRLYERIKELEAALRKIKKWHGEFPKTGRFWDNGEEMSYGTAFGSNGERDYMREVARIALEGE